MAAVKKKQTQKKEQPDSRFRYRAVLFIRLAATSLALAFVGVLAFVVP